MYKLGFEEAKEPEIKLPRFIGSWKKRLVPNWENKARLQSSRKTSIAALLTIPKPLTVWITVNCGKFLK